MNFQSSGGGNQTGAKKNYVDLSISAGNAASDSPQWTRLKQESYGGSQSHNRDVKHMQLSSNSNQKQSSVIEYMVIRPIIDASAFVFNGFENDWEMEQKLAKIKDMNREPSLLREAVYHDSAPLIRKLIESGADPNLEINRGILHSACKSMGGRDPIRVLEALLGSFKDLDATDERENTPLYYLVRGGHEVAAKFLIDSKANIEVPAHIGNDQTSLLWLAVHENRQSFVKYFLHLGLDHTITFRKRSILQQVFDKKMYDIVEFMLKNDFVDIKQAQSVWSKQKGKICGLVTAADKEMQHVSDNYDMYIEEAFLVIFFEIILTIPIECCDGWICDRAFFTPDVRKWIKYLENYYASNDGKLKMLKDFDFSV